MLQQTGNMFTEFEAAARDGLLEKLEKGEDIGEIEELEDIDVSETDAEFEEFEDIEAEDESGVTEELQEIEEVGAEESTEAIEEPEVTEEPAETTEEPEASEESTEATEEPETSEESAETTEEPEASEESAEATEESETSEEPAEATEAPETSEEPAEVTEESEAAEESAEAIEEPEAAEESTEATEEPETSEESAETIEEPETAEAAESLETSQEAEDVKDESKPVKEKVRPMTREEREHFSAYIQSRETREQIVKTIDDATLAAYTGNVIITGEVDVDTIPLAKKVVREIQANDSNFSGQVAKISGHGLSQKNMEETIDRLQNGALIIQNASGMSAQTVQDLHKALQRENLGIVVVLQDDTKSMETFLEQNSFLKEEFTSRIDVRALSNDMLVAYGRQYAKEQECSIDDLGVLALHNRIEKRQTIDHAVTMAEVKEIVDEAIRHAKRVSVGHFVGILVGKRYDEEDMIIVTEKDFV